MKKRYFALLMLVCLTLALLGGCFFEKEKEYSKAGMTITLTTKFTEKELASQTADYESTTALVTALKEEFSLAAGLEKYSLKQYTDAVLSQNKISAKIDMPEGKSYYSFSYEKTMSGKTYYYFATTFKAKDAFWLIQFACTTANKEKLQDNFTKWADSVKFE